MKKIPLILLLFSIVAMGFAQEKVVDKSKRRAPKWVNGVQQNYIIAMGFGESIQEAKNVAMDNVKSKIASSVAVFVKTKSETRSEQVNNNNTFKFFDSFQTSTSVETADLPFLKGISINRASDFYWEKLKNKKTKKIHYNYHIKYAFTEYDMRKLIKEFEAIDKKLTDQLNELLDARNTVSSVEEIEANIKKLQNLVPAFRDQRKMQAQEGILEYKKMLKSINLVITEKELGRVVYVLKIGNQVITTSRKPKIKSDCAQITNVQPQDDEWLVEYLWENCYEDDENSISISLKAGTARFKRKVIFDITKKMLGIFVKNDINITSDDGFEFTIPFTMEHAGNITIDKVILKWKKYPALIFNNIGQSFSAKGDHDLKLTYSKSINTDKCSSDELISGSIRYTMEDSGESFTYKLFNQSVTTDW